MPGSPSIVADALAPLALTELEAATLQDRVDVKYVVPRDDLGALVARLRGSHRVLEIGGRRAFAYRTTYFDTPDLQAFRDHVQQRRRRYKCRAREYVDSGLCTFEVKLKGPRGRTVKHRVPHGTRPDALGEPALGFLRECVGAAYGFEPAGPLGPVLVGACGRRSATPSRAVTASTGSRSKSKPLRYATSPSATGGCCACPRAFGA